MGIDYLYPEYERCGHVYTYSPYGIIRKFRIGCKNHDEQFRHKYCHRPQCYGVYDAGPQQQEECSLHPVSVARPIVKAYDRLSALGDALQRQHGKLHHAAQDGHSSHGYITSVFQQRRIEAHCDSPLCRLHDKR